MWGEGPPPPPRALTPLLSVPGHAEPHGAAAGGRRPGKARPRPPPPGAPDGPASVPPLRYCSSRVPLSPAKHFFGGEVLVRNLGLSFMTLLADFSPQKKPNAQGRVREGNPVQRDSPEADDISVLFIFL